MDDFITEFLNIPDITVLNYKIVGDVVNIYIESNHTNVACRKCGRQTKSKGLGQEIKLRHLPILGRTCYLILRPKRGICEHCDDAPTTNQRLNWYEYKSHYTKEYENHILFSLVNSTVVDVSIKESLGADAVDGILGRRVDRKINWNKVSSIGLLGLDEISLKKGHRDFATIITSRVENKTRILGVIKGREKSKIRLFLRGVPKKLRRTIAGICSDMYDGYINAAKEVFSNKIPVIVDRFHVAKLYRKNLTYVT